MMLSILIFVFLQGLAINGFQLSMDDGMIFNPYKKWLQKKKSWIGKPLGLCIKCMSSVGGSITFWPIVLYKYGWHPIEVFAGIIDIFILIYLF